MPFIDQLNELLLRTWLDPLVLLLLPAARDDRDAAWTAARDMIRLYDPQSQPELRLACLLAVFSLQATQTAVKAGAAGLSASDTARLCNAATAFAREADKAERRLEKLQNARNQDFTPQTATQFFRNPPSETQPAETETTKTEAFETKTLEPGLTQHRPGENPLSPAKKEELRRIAAYARKHNLTYPQAWTQHELEKKRQAAEDAMQRQALKQQAQA
jgi:hypothetical protein